VKPSLEKPMDILRPRRSLRRCALAAAVLLCGAAVQAVAAPTLASVSPASAPVDAQFVYITLTGSGFQSGSTAWWNLFTPLPTIYDNSSQVRAYVGAHLLTAPAVAKITVRNPDGTISGLLDFTVSANPLVISTAALPAAVPGAAYTFQLAASGGTPAYAWDVVGILPPGLALSASGALAGIPTTSGTWGFSIRVTDSAAVAAIRQFSLTVAPSLSISTASPLPVGRVAAAYSQTLAATGGALPYRWAAGSGIPPGLLLDAATGVLAGTPNQVGSYSFTVRVTDRDGFEATTTLALTIRPQAVSIATEPPLFSGTAGLPYSQPFAAAGGAPPYRWTIVSSPVPGLGIDITSGNLTGTPPTAGTWALTVQVTDSAGESASKNFTLRVLSPTLDLTTPSTLPGGNVGIAYSQRFSVAGGTPPYTWSMPAGWMPGLSIDASTGVLAGTPVQPGAFTFFVQAADSAGLTVSKSFTLTVGAAALAIATDSQLPGGTIGQEYAAAVAAIGGAPPYAWSAVGLPAGLELNAETGAVTGVPGAPGSFTFNVRVTDSLRATSLALFRVSFDMPPLPGIRIWGLPVDPEPASQHGIAIDLEGPFPVALTGQLLLSFVPDAGGGDATIRFSNGGRSAPFRLPAGATTAEFDAPNLAVQTGTVAGSILLTVQLQSSGVDVTPAPAPAHSARIGRGAPVIARASFARTANGFAVQITGYCTSREITEAVFRFRAASGSTLQQAEVKVAMEAVATAWYGDPASQPFGSQFTFTQPFTIQGDANAVIPVSVTLTNRLGNDSADISQ
jgi:hypothetical protein